MDAEWPAPSPRPRRHFRIARAVAASRHASLFGLDSAHLYGVVDRGASLSAMRVTEAPGLQIGAQVALTPGVNGVAAGIEAGAGLEWKG